MEFTAQDQGGLGYSILLVKRDHYYVCDNQTFAYFVDNNSMIYVLYKEIKTHL